MNDLLLLSPEIIITVVAFGILTLDIAWNGDRRSITILPWVAFAGAIATLLAAFYIWPAASDTYAITTDAASSVPMMAVDRLAIFFKIIAALTVALVGLSAVDYLKTRTSRTWEPEDGRGRPARKMKETP